MDEEITKIMKNAWDVVVIGSCMIDLVCYTPRLPKSGETLKGSDFSINFGGKGCNQCVAAKKLGANTLFLGRVGDDSFGTDYLRHLLNMNISTDHVRVTKNATTGIAQITVADNGENHIVVVPGANNAIVRSDLTEVENAIINCKVLMCQMEINQETTLKALEIKANSGIGKSIFNGAPATSNLSSDFYSLPDIFCVNESEAEIFTGFKVSNLNEAKKAAKELNNKGCREVILTLGDQGALYSKINNKEVLHVPADKVTAVDTTGAGDAFIGALGFYISNYPAMKMPEIIKRSCVAAGLSVQKRGTQQSFPSFSELKLK